MPERRDYYEVLGISREASADEIRNAYRRLARQYHPDVNKAPDAAERFKEINEAYQVLGDEQRRQNYDRFGHAGAPDMAGFEGFAGFGGLGDIFEDLFGMGMPGRSRSAFAPQRGADLQAHLRISFREAVFGATREIEVSRLEPCDRCNGSGAEPGTSPTRCPTCGGSGEVRRVQQTILGSFVNVSTCPNCGGRGEVIGTRCSKCGGEGKVRTTRKLEVHIPAGVDSGTRIRLSGEGDSGTHGGPAGNLYVLLEVEDDPLFQRRDDDIILEQRINIAQAALGATISVPTLEGEEQIKIAPGTQSGRTFRLRGKGVPHLQRGGRGDQIVVIRVVTPTNLNAKQRRLLEEFATSLDDGNMAADEPSFIERMKGVLGL